jgi:hypothetical protein
VKRRIERNMVEGVLFLVKKKIANFDFGQAKGI